MRALMCLLIASVAANSAQAQLRLPVAPLPPLPVQKLTQTVGQTGAGALDQLSEVRHLQIARLIRANPRVIEADPRGNPVVRDEVLAMSPTAQAVDAAQARGFRIVREQTIGDLDFHLVVLQPPARMSTAKALRELREADPAGTYDFNHIYLGVGAAALGVAASPRPDSTEADGAAQSVPRVGLVDSGVDVSHPVFQGAVMHTWGCGEHLFAGTHGTAVASLLVGQSTNFHGMLDRAELYAADVYCNAPTGGAVDAAILLPPFNFFAESAGYTNLGNTVDYAKDLPFAGAVVGRSWAASHKATFDKILKIHNMSLAWFADPKNRDEAIQMMVVESKAKEDVVAKSYDFYQKNEFFDVSGKVSRSKMTALLKVLKELGDVEGSIEVERFVLPGVALVD